MLVYQRRKKRRRWSARVGDTVEIEGREVGFLGSWYQATIIEQHGTTGGGGGEQSPSSTTFKVRYLTLHDDAKQPVEEVVSAIAVRPTPPPPLSVASYHEGDAVEAFDRDGWWVGSVTREMPDGRYQVYFQASEDENVYAAAQLRPRQDWLDCQWQRVQFHQEDHHPQPVDTSPLRKRPRLDVANGTRKRSPRQAETAPSPKKRSPSPKKRQPTTVEPPRKRSPRQSPREPELPLPPAPAAAPDNAQEMDEPPQDCGWLAQLLKNQEHAERLAGFKGGNREAMVKDLQMLAYSLVLRAFRLRMGQGLTWQQEHIISELRLYLDINHEMHIRELDALKKINCSCATCSGAAAAAAAANT